MLIAQKILTLTGLQSRHLQCPAIISSLTVAGVTVICKQCGEKANLQLHLRWYDVWLLLVFVELSLNSPWLQQRWGQFYVICENCCVISMMKPTSTLVLLSAKIYWAFVKAKNAKIYFWDMFSICCFQVTLVSYVLILCMDQVIWCKNLQPFRTRQLQCSAGECGAVWVVALRVVSCNKVVRADKSSGWLMV
jgi:hypothetical protein